MWKASASGNHRVCACGGFFRCESCGAIATSSVDADEVSKSFFLWLIFRFVIVEVLLRRLALISALRFVLMLLIGIRLVLKAGLVMRSLALHGLLDKQRSDSDRHLFDSRGRLLLEWKVEQSLRNIPAEQRTLQISKRCLL